MLRGLDPRHAGASIQGEPHAQGAVEDEIHRSVAAVVPSQLGGMDERAAALPVPFFVWRSVRLRAVQNLHGSSALQSLSL